MAVNNTAYTFGPILKLNISYFTPKTCPETVGNIEKCPPSQQSDKATQNKYIIFSSSDLV